MSQPAAEPRTFKEAEERLLVVLRQRDPPPADFAHAFRYKFEKQFPLLAAANLWAVIDSAVIHNAIQAQDDDLLASLFTNFPNGWTPADARRIAHYTVRLADDDLLEVRDRVRATYRDDSNPVTVMLDAELRKRTPDKADLESVLTYRDLELSNAGGFLQQRFDRADNPTDARDRIGEFLGETVLPSRPLTEKQKLRMKIDELRRTRDKERHPTRPQTGDEREWHRELREVFYLDMVYLLDRVQDPGVWTSAIDYLTIAELVGVYNYALRCVLSDSFIRRLQVEVDRARTERTDAEASGLIQRLARRDGDAARQLSTWLSRSVNLRQAQTHFRSHAQLAVAAFLALPTDDSHKRRIQRAGGASSSKKPRGDDDESKEQMEGDDE